MPGSMVFTFIGIDKPGLIERLAHTVSQYGGNWLESRMSQLAGQFAGIVQIEISAARRGALSEALRDLAGIGLTIVIAADTPEPTAARTRLLRLSIIGNDRPGIVLEVATALAQRDINVLEMDTCLTSAPMTADPLFEATAAIEIPQTLDLDDLNRQLDEIAEMLTVDIDLEQALR